MKHFHVWFGLLLFFHSVFPAVALAEETSCFINPNGGHYYHRERSCERVNAAYQDELIEIEISLLAEEPYCHLLQCTGCFGLVESAMHQDVTLPLYYKSPFDTGNDTLYLSEGTYASNKEVPPGVYTAHSNSRTRGSLFIYNSDFQLLREIYLEDESTYSFYLPADAFLTIPANCIVKKVVHNPLFQIEGKQYAIRHARYFSMLEIPGRRYFVSNIPGQCGKIIQSTISSEIGETCPTYTEVEDGKVLEIDLEGAYDIFIEINNCIVWFSTGAEG